MFPCANPCQEFFFPLENCPSKIVMEAQHHSNCVNSDSNLTRSMNPLKRKHYVNPLKEKLSHIPNIKWKYPPKFSLDYKWRVAAGEESQEAEAQNHREMQTLETVHACCPSIHHSHSMSLNSEDCHDEDDSNVPLVPINPIEDQAATADLPFDLAGVANSSVKSQPLDMPQDPLTAKYLNTPNRNPPVSLNPLSPHRDSAVPLDPHSANGKPALIDGDVVAAAAAAATAIIKCKELGSLIDTDLLIKFLSNPKMIEKMINEHEAAANTGNEPIPVPKPVTESVSVTNLEPDKMVKKFTGDNGAPTNTGTVPVSGPEKEVIPSAPLPSSKPEAIKKLTHENRSPESIATTPISCQPPVPLPNSTSEATKKLTNENGPHVNIATTPYSWSPSVPFTRSNADEMMIKKLVSKHAHIENKPISGSKHVNSKGTFPTSKPDTVMVKRTIEYGAPYNVGNGPIPASKSMSRVPPFSTPKPDMVMPKRRINAAENIGNKPISRSKCSPVVPFSFSKSTEPEMHVLPRPHFHSTENWSQPSLRTRLLSPDTVQTSSFSATTAPLPPVKDINYYKSLIKQHGEIQEKVDHDHLQIPKMPNYVSAQNPKSRDLKNNKPCMYFNSSKGCLNGSSCPYKHDLQGQMKRGGAMEAHGAKRIKL